MLFHNPVYLLIFLPLVFCIYFIIPKTKINTRLYVLIISGIIFYSYWNYKFAPLIIFSILINYLLSEKISKSCDFFYKKRILFFSITFNILYLCFFKYSDFVISNINFFFDTEIPFLNLPFPLALSFVTFQTIAFLVDVFDDNIQKNNLKRYSLFIIFFPQLIAGPIVRFNEMISQFEDIKNSKIQFKNICLGLIVICIGLAKKILIADNLSIIVDNGFSSEKEIGFFGSWLVTFSFAFQLYFDFSGYIDMATGSALLFNIKLPRNFNSPFKANSIINFWQRWHITLSNFLTNYIYNPYLRSFKELTFFKSMIGVMIVFLIAGLWHGPSWLFVLFGALHGLGLVFNHIYKKFIKKEINQFYAQLLTFVYVSFTLIFFRAQNFDEAFNIIKGLFDFSLEIEFILNSVPLTSLILFIISIIICFMLKNTGYIIERLDKSRLF